MDYDFFIFCMVPGLVQSLIPRYSGPLTCISLTAALQHDLQLQRRLHQDSIQLAGKTIYINPYLYLVLIISLPLITPNWFILIYNGEINERILAYKARLTYQKLLDKGYRLKGR